MGGYCRHAEVEVLLFILILIVVVVPSRRSGQAQFRLVKSLRSRNNAKPI